MSVALVTGPYPAYRLGLSRLLRQDCGFGQIAEADHLGAVSPERLRQTRLLVCFSHQGQREDFSLLRRQPGNGAPRVLISECLGRQHRRWLARGLFDLVLPMTVTPVVAANLINRALTGEDPCLGYEALELPSMKAGFEPDIRDLTRGEQRVLDCLQLGLSNEAIANRMAIATNTVKVHLARICRKTGAQNRTQAIALLNHVSTNSC